MQCYANAHEPLVCTMRVGVKLDATCILPISNTHVMHVIHACHVFADRLDLPNASRTNKTFTSGLVRGARREASTAVAPG